MLKYIRDIQEGIAWRRIASAVNTMNVVRPAEEHLKPALEWLKSSLETNGGSSAKFSLWDKKYYPAYPETTGYWINTLYRCMDHYPELYKSVFGGKNIAEEMVQWLLSVQRLDGTFPGSYGDYANQAPRIFNTGQILLGLLDDYKRSKNENVKRAMIKATDWLLSVQDDDGCWRQFTNYQHSSNTRTAWALLQMGIYLDDARMIKAGTRNLDYAVSCQNKNGYYVRNGFTADPLAFTHTIAYAIDGLLQSGILMQNEQWKSSAHKALVALSPLVKEDGSLAGKIGENLECDHSFVCLTGNCQLAIDYFILAKLNNDEKLRTTGTALLNYVKKHQVVSGDPRSHGGIPGSWPLWGEYNPLVLPNWPVKFFADALMQEKFPEQVITG